MHKRKGMIKGMIKRNDFKRKKKRNDKRNDSKWERKEMGMEEISLDMIYGQKIGRETRYYSILEGQKFIQNRQV